MDVGATLSSYQHTSCTDHSGQESGQPGIQPYLHASSLEKVVIGGIPEPTPPPPPCPFALPQAGLRRSFRLGCRERLGGSQEAKVPAGAESQELLTYEEVARYQQQPGERPRLVVLIGR